MCPTAFDYKLVADNDSMYNTPPTYAIYIAGLVLKWIDAQGGVTAMEAHNRKKAAVLYDYLDSTSFYQCPVAREDRSLMNVPFRLPDEKLDEPFLKGAQARGLVQLKGHRSVGGMRASIYNAMPIDGVRALVVYMKEFEAKQAEPDVMNDPGAEPDLRQRPVAAAGRALPRRQGRRRPGGDPAALGRPAQGDDRAHRAGDRARRRRHQQHPGRADERARRAGVQRAGRQRQCGEGAGAGRHADGGAPDRAGAALRRHARRQGERPRRHRRRRQEGVRRHRTGRPHAGRDRPGQDRLPGRRRRHQARHAGARPRPRHHGRRRLEPAVAGEARHQRQRGAARRPTS